MSTTEIPAPWPACWPDGQGGLIVADVAVQDPRVLLAVHEPPVLRRRPVPLRGQTADRDSAEDATQWQLLDLLVDGACPQGTLLVPILGAPGTGKSHLIRWLAAAMPARENLEIRHIPRERTSLPKVVEILFDGLEGPEFDRIRTALHSSRAQYDGMSGDERMEQVADRLLNRINELVMFGLRGPWQRAAGVDDELRSALCDRYVLPALLSDAPVRDLLTRAGGAVHRLAQDIVEGRDRPPGDEQEELGFRAEDLRIQRTRGLGPHAAQALMRLKLPGAEEAAAAILSDALDEAAPAVMGLAEISLVDAIEDLRVELLRQDKELVLLFEDIAVTRGLQLDLIDALTTPAIRDNEQKLCTMRVAIAVTSSYWDEKIPETLSTRAHAWKAQIFDLDVPDGALRAPDLIGRYLNAARLGLENLQKRPPGDTEVANACDLCPRRVPCHGAFGTSDAGHGLFPLTKAAAQSLAEVADADARPRLVLSSLVGPLLQEREALERGAFPGVGGIDPLIQQGVDSGYLGRLPIEVTHAVDEAKLDPEDDRRARALLRAWGLTHLDRILELFGLPSALAVPVEGATGRPRAKQRAQKPDTGNTETAQEPADRDLDRLALEEWADGRELNVKLSRDLRGLAWQELRDGLRWNEIGGNRGSTLELLGMGSTQVKGQQANVAVRIERASGGGAIGENAEPLVTFLPSVASVKLFGALLTHGRPGSGSAQGEARAAARVRAFVAQVEAELADRVKARIAAPEHLADAAKLMTLAAAPLVVDLSIAGSPSFGSALTRTPKDLEPVSGVSDEWARLRAEAREAHRLGASLVVDAATKSQGEGDPTVLDPTAIDLAAVDKDPYGLTRGLGVGDLRECHDRLVALAQSAVEKERDNISRLVESIEVHVGTGAPLALKTIRDAVDAALAAAEAAHLLRPPDARETLSASTLLKSGDAAKALDAARSAVSASSAGFSVDSLTRLARVDRASLIAIGAFLDSAAASLESSEGLARQAIRQRGGQSGATDAARAATDALLSVCERLL